MKIQLLVLMLITALFLIGCTAPVQPEQTVTTEPIVETYVPIGEGMPEEQTEVIAPLSGDIEIVGKEGFVPLETTVSVNEEVTFLNKGTKEAVLTFQKDATQKFLNSNIIKSGATGTMIFTEPGTYTYWEMGYGVKGKLIVE